MSLGRDLRLPYPPYARRVARNAAVVWLLVRLFLAVPPPVGPGVLLLNPGAGLLLVAAVSALVWLDGRRFHEHRFHANLGASQAWTVAIALVVAGALEALAYLFLPSLLF